MPGFFSIDSPFSRVINKISDIIILNILYMIFCIPVITIGAANTALYSVTLKMVKDEEGGIVSGFFDAFKKNFKSSTIIWILFLALNGLMGADIYLSRTMGLPAFMSIIIGVFMIVLNLLGLYLFPLEARFVNSIRGTAKNAFLMSIVHLPYTILIGVIHVFPIVLMIYFMPVIPAYLIIGFSGTAFVSSIFFRKIFLRYEPEITQEEE